MIPWIPIDEQHGWTVVRKPFVGDNSASDHYNKSWVEWVKHWSGKPIRVKFNSHHSTFIVQNKAGLYLRKVVHSQMITLDICRAPTIFELAAVTQAREEQRNRLHHELNHRR